MPVHPDSAKVYTDQPPKECLCDLCKRARLTALRISIRRRAPGFFSVDTIYSRRRKPMFELLKKQKGRFQSHLGGCHRGGVWRPFSERNFNGLGRKRPRASSAPFPRKPEGVKLRLFLASVFFHWLTKSSLVCATYSASLGRALAVCFSLKRNDASRSLAALVKESFNRGGALRVQLKHRPGRETQASTCLPRSPSCSSRSAMNP